MMRAYLFLLLLFPCQLHAQHWVRTSGDVLLVGLPALAVGKCLYHQDKEGFYQYANTAAVTALVTYGLKWSVDKERPDGDRYSFPSGHSAFTFAAAGFVQKRHGWSWGTPAYALAAYTGFTRIHAHRHDPWDVLAGAGIGIAAAQLLSTPLFDKLEVRVIGSPESGMLAVRYAF